jgi:predicted deacylase
VQKKQPVLVNPDEVTMAVSNFSGFFVPEINLGEWIEKGSLVGKVISPNSGNVLEEIIASSNGLVFTLREYPMTYEGSVVARIANKELVS